MQGVPYELHERLYVYTSYQSDQFYLLISKQYFQSNQAKGHHNKGGE